MTTGAQPATGSEGHDPAAVDAPTGATAAAAPAGAYASRITASERDGSGVVVTLLLGVGAALVLLVVAVLLLVMVVLPLRDGKKSWDSAGETYRELHSMSYAAGWRTDPPVSDPSAIGQ